MEGVSSVRSNAEAFTDSEESGKDRQIHDSISAASSRNDEGSRYGSRECMKSHCVLGNLSPLCFLMFLIRFCVVSPGRF